MRTPAAVLTRGTPTREVLDGARAGHAAIRARLVAEQEELDWDVYARYRLLDEPLTYVGDDLPPLAPGQRAFEIVLARRVAAGQASTSWFVDHGSTPVTEPPEHWPTAYRAVVERRIARIETDRTMRLLERPEHKRHWDAESWAEAEERALRHWLLDRLEDRGLWFDDAGRPCPRSLAGLAHDIARDAEATEMLAFWADRRDVPAVATLARLLAPEAAPYLAALRHTEAGLRKRAVWEEVWERQRAEDADSSGPRPATENGDDPGPATEGSRRPIPTPPTYTVGDFRSRDVWARRGTMDVPKERFIAYPDAETPTDPSAVLGWTGWDHAEQALALVRLFQTLRDDGTPDERLVPLLAGLDELLPWVQQWHGEPNPGYGQVPAEYVDAFLTEQCAALAVTREQLHARRSPDTRRARTPRGRRS